MDTYNASVVVHIDENLTPKEIHDLERDISYMQGIICACVHDQAPHLMPVDYDPKILQTRHLLTHIQHNGLHPSLIGDI